MSVTPHPKYSGHWVIRFYPNGKKKDPETGKVKREYLVFKGTEAEAEAYHVELIRAARPGRGPVHATPTFDQMFVDFCEYYKNKSAKNTYTDFLVKWKRLHVDFGSLRPNHLTPALIETYKSARVAEGVKPSSVNKELNFLASMVSWATDPAQGLANPLSFQIRRFPRKLSAAPIPIVPSRDQILAVIDHVGEDVRPLAALLYFAGLRFSEAAGLYAEDIRVDQGVIVIRKGKGGKSRVVPIVAPLSPYLAAIIKKIPTGPLFVNKKTKIPIKSIKKSLAAAGKRAGVSIHIHAHLLRHGFGTHSTMDGVGLRVLQDVMGHSSPQVTEIYTTLAAQTLISEFGKWGNSLSPVDNKTA